jgi:hypothetical protein
MRRTCRSRPSACSRSSRRSTPRWLPPGQSTAPRAGCGSRPRSTSRRSRPRSPRLRSRTSPLRDGRPSNRRRWGRRCERRHTRLTPTASLSRRRHRTRRGCCERSPPIRCSTPTGCRAAPGCCAAPRATCPRSRRSSGCPSRSSHPGPAFLPGDSGAALGLVPEVQTFGGTTGRKPADVGATSALLSRLLRHGILALPPSSGSRGGRRVVGGPLVTEHGELSWPRWTVSCGLRELRVLFSLATVHDAEPDARALRERGVDAVYRSRPQQLSTTVAVFRWGRRVV